MVFIVSNAPQWRVCGIDNDGRVSYYETFNTQSECDIVCDQRNRINHADRRWESRQICASDVL